MGLSEEDHEQHLLSPDPYLWGICCLVKSEIVRLVPRGSKIPNYAYRGTRSTHCPNSMITLFSSTSDLETIVVLHGTSSQPFAAVGHRSMHS